MFVWSENCILKELCDFFAEFGEKPCNIMATDLSAVAGTLNMWITVNGGKCAKRYIDSSETWEISFTLNLRYRDTCDEDRLAAFRLLEDAANFAEVHSVKFDNMSVFPKEPAQMKGSPVGGKAIYFTEFVCMKYFPARENEGSQVYLKSGEKLGRGITKFEISKKAVDPVRYIDSLETSLGDTEEITVIFELDSTEASAEFCKKLRFPCLDLNIPLSPDEKFCGKFSVDSLSESGNIMFGKLKACRRKERE